MFYLFHFPIIHNMKITNYNIILGSNSPRRKEILSQIGFEFEVRISEEEELYPKRLKGKEVSEFLAIKKSENLQEGLKENRTFNNSGYNCCRWKKNTNLNKT